ncbi:MAG: hypothetical protein ACYTE3_08185 [Planctomycetota bacterium]|jgi:hypothetical protein
MTGFEVIYWVREHPGILVSTLTERFAEEEANSIQGTEGEIRTILKVLENFKLVALQVVEGGISTLPGEQDAVVSLTPLWTLLYEALGISLSKIRGLRHHDAFSVRPLFGTPAQLGDGCDVFVVMPFKEEMKRLYRDHIVSAVEAMGLSCLRADDIFSGGSVVRDIWSGIFSSRVIVADCTGRNPNVFYEIGVAHTLGKPVVLITQTEEDVPFDVRYLRYITYCLRDDALERFREQLVAAVGECLKNGMRAM